MCGCLQHILGSSSCLPPWRRYKDSGDCLLSAYISDWLFRKLQQLTRMFPTIMSCFAQFRHDIHLLDKQGNSVHQIIRQSSQYNEIMLLRWHGQAIIKYEQTPSDWMELSFYKLLMNAGYHIGHSGNRRIYMSFVKWGVHYNVKEDGCHYCWQIVDCGTSSAPSSWDHLTLMVRGCWWSNMKSSGSMVSKLLIARQSGTPPPHPQAIVSGSMIDYGLGTSMP